MRIIHTYVPTRVGFEVNKSLLQNMIYSVKKRITELKIKKYFI